MDHSPDGLDYSVYADDRLIAKFADRELAITCAKSCTWKAHKVQVNQIDSDFSPHLGRKIWSPPVLDQKRMDERLW